MVERQVEDAAAAIGYCYWAGKQPLRLMLPVGMLRMHGGFDYGPDHPFRRALSEGPEALTRFYDGFQPQTIAQIYDLPEDMGAGAGLAQWEVPWRLREKRVPPPGEKGLSAKHGVAFYGPCTPQKVALEQRRLTGTLASVKAKGFDPDRHGDIEGQMLTDGRRVAFMVLGGKHRAAVLAHLGQSHIPVRLRAGLMPLIDARVVQDWPLVASGEMAAEVARAVMARYLEGRGMADVLRSAAPGMAAGKGRDIGE